MIHPTTATRTEYIFSFYLNRRYFKIQPALNFSGVFCRRLNTKYVSIVWKAFTIRCNLSTIVVFVKNNTDYYSIGQYVLYCHSDLLPILTSSIFNHVFSLQSSVQTWLTDIPTYQQFTVIFHLISTAENFSTKIHHSSPFHSILL